MIVTITADGSRLTVQQPILADGTAGSVRVRFCMDADWAGLTLTAVFRTPRGDILMPLTDGACDLPAAATEKCGSVLVGVFGTDGTRTLTSTFCRLRISPGVPTEGEAAENYTPGLYEQFAAKFARFENMTADAVAGDEANVAVQEKDGALYLHFTLPQGEKGDTGEQGPQGEKGDKGAQGPQGEKGDKGEKGDSTEIVQQVGGSEQAVMSQKAVTDAFAQFVATDAIADGINMLDITTCTPGKIMTGTGAVKDHDSYMLTDYIKVEAGKTYSFYLGAIGDTYCYPGYLFYCANFDATKKLISSDNGYQHRPYTVPEGVSYIRASVSSSAAYGERMICEYAGDGVPLEYSPYSGHTKLKYRTNDLGFITPEMFGAVGDGTTDDHAAFQACFNASAGKTILIGNKKYYLSAPIKLDKDIFTYTVQGFANATAYITAERGYIMCGADFLDGTNDAGYEEEYNICLRNMQFISADADGGYAWLKNIRNSNGMIEQCTVANFGYAIYGGMCDRAIISNSTFFGIGKAFICEGDNDRTWTSAGITDSSIVNCYVNGAPSKNPSVFVLSTAFTASVIENCYFDFFKDAICPVLYEDEDGCHYQTCNYSDTVFLGCTFEIFWRIVRAELNDYENDEETIAPTPLRFVSCFFHWVSQTYMHSFTNADDEMKNADGTYTKFGVVVQDVSEENVRKLSLRNIVFENNVFNDVEYPIYIDDADGEWMYRNISERGSIMTAPYGKVPNGVFFCAPICEADAKTVYFESMNGKDYTALPEVTAATNATVGSGYKLNGCFEGMKIFYNGKPAIMHDFKWIDYTGQELT